MYQTHPPKTKTRNRTELKLGWLSHLYIDGPRALPSPCRPDQSQQPWEISVGIGPGNKVHPAPLKKTLLLARTAEGHNWPCGPQSCKRWTLEPLLVIQSL